MYVGAGIPWHAGNEGSLLLLHEYRRRGTISLFLVLMQSPHSPLIG
jgi:hypothetical protein